MPHTAGPKFLSVDVFVLLALLFSTISMAFAPTPAYAGCALRTM